MSRRRGEISEGANATLLGRLCQHLDADILFVVIGIPLAFFGTGGRVVSYVSRSVTTEKIRYRTSAQSMADPAPTNLAGLGRFPSAIQSFSRNVSGATAIEFAVVAIPLLMLLLVPIELGLMSVAQSALETAVAKEARIIRTGRSEEYDLDDDGFRSAVCKDIGNIGDCLEKLSVVVVSTEKIEAIKNDGQCGTTEKSKSQSHFVIGKGKEYQIIQALLPWSPILPIVPLGPKRPSDGAYLLCATVLFQNEPF